MKRRLFLIFIINLGFIYGMDKEVGAPARSHVLECMRVASIIKNRIYELKAELNYKDKSGYLSIMHLCILNPLQNQTKQGIFLECIDGVPCAIHLPFGRWQFAQPDATHEGHALKLMNQIMGEFDLDLCERKFQNLRKLKDGTRIGFGPLISIYLVKGKGQNVLEKAVYKEETEYMDAQHAKAAWKALITE